MMKTAPLRYNLARGCHLVLQRGDLTRWQGDAIVNAANERMLGGGGVDGAIHRRAGPELLELCRAVPEVSRGVRCPTGEARITGAGRLPVRHVIHTVGPIFESSAVSGPLLRSAYRSSAALAKQHSLKTIAFPAISCGVYGYPYGLAAKEALSALAEEAEGLSEVHFVLFEEEAWAAWVRAAEEALGHPQQEPAPASPAAAGATPKPPPQEGAKGGVVGSLLGFLGCANTGGAASPTTAGAAKRPAGSPPGSPGEAPAAKAPSPAAADGGAHDGAPSGTAEQTGAEGAAAGAAGEQAPATAAEQQQHAR